MYAIQKTVMTLLLLVATAALATASMAENHNASKAAPSKFVGTFYSDGITGAMVTVHSDGTMEHIYTDMFARGNRRVTPALGVWRQSGDNEIKVTWVRFATELFGDNFSPNGLISKLSYRMVYDELVRGKFAGYSVSSVLIEQFLPGQNPVTDEPILSLEVPASSTGFRLEVE